MKQLKRRSFFGMLAGFGVALGLVKQGVSYEEMERAYNDTVVGNRERFEQADFTLTSSHPLDARFTDEKGRVFQLVTRARGDSFHEDPPEDIKGKMVYWEDRKKLLVSAYGGPHPAGIAAEPIAPGQWGFIQVGGPSPGEVIYFHGVPIEHDLYVPGEPVEEQVERAYHDASETLLTILAKQNFPVPGA